ncbi:MAG: hypothetical protein JXB10_02155 [Pirellulales bacterium]|nr:hypothetical protein [Pirellulales bacterium]
MRKILLAAWFALPAFLLLAAPRLEAVVVQTIGPFDVSFFNQNESYSDGGTTYTGTKNWTAAEMADVAAMILAWDDGILNPAGPRQITLNVMWDNLGSGTLGLAFDKLTGDYSTAWTNVEYLWRESLSPTSTGPDVLYRFSTAFNWHTGASLPGTNEIDFRSVVCHEIGHSLGFTSTYDLGSDSWWLGGLTAWDKCLRDAPAGGNMPLVNGTGTPGNFNQTAAPVYFNGVNANAANGGSRMAVYAPSSFENGSSLIHPDESTYPNALMSPQLSYGQVVREPTVLEWQMMNDLGWNTVMKTWTNGAGGKTWGTSGNWTPANIPDSSRTASFTNAGLSAGDTITLGGDRSVRNLIFDTTTSFSIGGGSGALVLATGDLTRTASSSGTQTVARPVILGSDAVWDVAGSGQLTVSGLLLGAYPLEKRGAGTLKLTGGLASGGITLIDVQAGKTVLAATNVNRSNLNVHTAAGATWEIDSGTHVLGSITGDGATYVLGSGRLTAASITQGSLTIGGVPPGDGPVIAVPEPATVVLLLLAAAASVPVLWKR